MRLELSRPRRDWGNFVRPGECLPEAPSGGGRLKDDRRSGQACAFLVNVHALLGELDEAGEFGERALETAAAVGSSEIRIIASMYLAQTHYYRGDYDRAIGLGIENVTARPLDRIDTSSVQAVGGLVNVRFWLVMSLAQVGRFQDAAQFEAEATRVAEVTHQPYAVGLARGAAATVSILKGDWGKACSVIEPGLAVVRNTNIGLMLSEGVALSAWALAESGEGEQALERINESEPLVEGLTTIGLIAHLFPTLHALGRACFRLGDRKSV